MGLRAVAVAVAGAVGVAVAVVVVVHYFHCRLFEVVDGLVIVEGVLQRHSSQVWCVDPRGPRSLTYFVALPGIFSEVVHRPRGQLALEHETATAGCPAYLLRTRPSACLLGPPQTNQKKTNKQKQKNRKNNKQKHKINKNNNKQKQKTRKTKKGVQQKGYQHLVAASPAPLQLNSKCTLGQQQEAPLHSHAPRAWPRKNPLKFLKTIL